MGLLRIRDLPIEVRIGALPEERISPQTVRLDLEVRTTFDRTTANDHLGSTVNYIELVEAVRASVGDRSCHLIETLASWTLDAALSLAGVSWARVRVRKYHLPGMGEVGHVEFEEESGRS